MQKTHQVIVDVFKACKGGWLSNPAEWPKSPEISKDTQLVFDIELGVALMTQKRSDA